MNEMLRSENRKHLIKQQTGQALVEYILLLSISVALVLAFATQFYKPFGNWMQNYMGEYLQCLLDYGELPTMGSVGVEGECSSQFQSFSLTGGRPPKSDRKNDSANFSTPANGAAEKSSGSAIIGSAGRSRSITIAGGRGADGQAGSGQGQKQVIDKLPDSEFQKFQSKKQSQNVGVASTSGQQTTINISSSQRQKSREQEKYVNLKNTEMEEGAGAGGKKRMLITPPEKKAETKEEGFSWNFGQYLKFALILAIIIAIVLFIGGQILQISKSMEK